MNSAGVMGKADVTMTGADGCNQHPSVPHLATRLEVAVGQATPHSSSSSRALSVRTRFEVFKRDDFTCRYCGRRSPEVVLQVDHITPRAAGGDDDPMNLATSCWECNSGKSDVSLDRVMTGEDPYDRALELLERERQVREYNTVLQHVRENRDRDVRDLRSYWHYYAGRDLASNEIGWLSGALKYCPREIIRDFMDKAIAKGATGSMSYVGGCVRAWRRQEDDL